MDYSGQSLHLLYTQVDKSNTSRRASGVIPPSSEALEIESVQFVFLDGHFPEFDLTNTSKSHHAALSAGKIEDGTHLHDELTLRIRSFTLRPRIKPTSLCARA